MTIGYRPLFSPFSPKSSVSGNRARGFAPRRIRRQPDPQVLLQGRSLRPNRMGQKYGVHETSVSECGVWAIYGRSC